MTEKERIIEILRSRLESRDDVHAFWVEGSVAQGYSDEYSDIDLWLSVDDDKIFTIFPIVEEALKEIDEIDFRHTVKKEGELGHNLYHLAGMSEFHSIDVNTQGLSRIVPLVNGIDYADIMFDKADVVRFVGRDHYTPEDLEKSREKLHKFYWYMEKCVRKNILRGRPLEALYYYQIILRYATKFLHLKYDLKEKREYDLKHIYRDIPEEETKKLESLYGVQVSNISNKLPELETWIKEL